MNKYYVFASGVDFKPKYYNTRKEAEISMYTFCVANNIAIECTEHDKHWRMYSDKKNVIFYINRD